MKDAQSCLFCIKIMKNNNCPAIPKQIDCIRNQYRTGLQKTGQQNLRQLKNCLLTTKRKFIKTIRAFPFSLAVTNFAISNFTKSKLIVGLLNNLSSLGLLQLIIFFECWSHSEVAFYITHMIYRGNVILALKKSKALQVVFFNSVSYTRKA